MSSNVNMPANPTQPERIKRYEDFWPYYLREHAKPATRRVHFIGCGLAILSMLLFILTANLLWFVLLPVAGYGPAWTGHFFIEKNKPATFRYPFWSLYSDFRMFFLWLGGQLQEQLQWAGVPLEERKPL